MLVLYYLIWYDLKDIHIMKYFNMKRFDNILCNFFRAILIFCSAFYSCKLCIYIYAFLFIFYMFSRKDICALGNFPCGSIGELFINVLSNSTFLTLMNFRIKNLKNFRKTSCGNHKKL